jgi:glycine hydroxymethyltransferase
MLSSSDPQIADLIVKETERQQTGVTLIPSENHTSKEVLEAIGTVFTDKYAEGYPGKRYYAGNVVVDELESLVQERAKALFGVPHANVQPYSGSPANFAIYLAALEPGDRIMGLELAHGGHLTHGYTLNATGKLWKNTPYHLKPDGYIDLDELRDLAKTHRPKLIICGGTAIPRAIPFSEIAEIADSVNALLLADVSHIGGLIAGGAHESPVPYAHIVMTTTHKTLRGPRGAMIMVTQKGMDKDPDLAKKIDKTIIPGFQGGPHLNTIAGIGVALKEAAEPGFKDYARDVVKNARTLADALIDAGFSLISGGTDNHLILIDLTPTGIGRGILYHEALEHIGVYTNKNTIPRDPSSPFYPSGLRIGTPAATTRGMTNSDMKQMASWIGQIGEHMKTIQVPDDKEERKNILQEFRNMLATDPFYETLRSEVRSLCERYPIPGV